MSASSVGEGLLRSLRGAFEAEADPARAAQMQRYMKSEIPYQGVPMPRVRALTREHFKALAFADRAAWTRAVEAIWSGARFREEWYAAMQLCGLKAARVFQTPEAMPLYEAMIVEGAWWDVVDELASHRVGDILRAHPGRMKPLMLRWSRDANLWKRRTAILSQARSKEGTDLELLLACIEPSLSSTEFFLRKAIGWALREYAKTEPDEVRRWVKAHEHELSPLSRREALKHLGSDAAQDARTV